MSLKIVFVSHSTTFDNEKKRASGWNDVLLSELGEKQAEELGQRQKNEQYDAVFISDLIRSVRTAQIAFKGRNIPLIRDRRLRECDYGDMTGYPNADVEAEKPKRLEIPFPNGESYLQTNCRMKAFLDETKQRYENGRILIVGHRATQYALEHLLNAIPMERLLTEKFVWRPSFEYEM